MVAKIEFNELMEAGVQFGHSQRYWNPKMAPYIYGVRRKLHIINLLKTRPLLQKATEVIHNIAAHNGKILFVATKRSAQQTIEAEATRAGMPYVNKRWPGGMLTNFKTILQSVKRMKYLEEFIHSDQVASLKKKERLSLERDLQKLKASFNGIRDMSSLPDALFVIDVGQEHIAVKEANNLGIPVIAVVDTNCSPDGINHIIPGNDDSQKAINLYTRIMTDAVVDARKDLEEKMSKAEKVKVAGKTTVKVVKKGQADAATEADTESKTAEKAKPKEPDTENESSKAPAKKKLIKVSAKQVESAAKQDDQEVKKASAVKKPAKKAAAKTAKAEEAKAEPKKKAPAKAKVAKAEEAKAEPKKKAPAKAKPAGKKSAEKDDAGEK